MRDRVPSLLTTRGPSLSSLTASPPTLSLVVVEGSRSVGGGGRGRGACESESEVVVVSCCWVSCGGFSTGSWGVVDVDIARLMLLLLLLLWVERRLVMGCSRDVEYVRRV